MKIDTCNGFELHRNDNFFCLIMPNKGSMVNACGTKEELIQELTRWKEQIDNNNIFMLTIENKFVNTLNSLA